MQYRVIGLMSGSSLDGLDIAFAELEETGGNWSYKIKAAECYRYDDVWVNKLTRAKELPAYNYLLLHTEFGKFCGEKVNDFIEKNDLHHKIQLIASHGHTVFHTPSAGVTSQLGNGAAIAAITGINVVSDLRDMDIALQGEGAPIVPAGEKLLWKEYDLFLNIGGIANISLNKKGEYVGFDVCPANRVLNMLANMEGKPCDKDGIIARSGCIQPNLLNELNGLEYYKKSSPKSLPDSFGTGVIFPLIQSYNLTVQNALRTYAEHIVQQISNSIDKHHVHFITRKLFVTGGGAFNIFLMERLEEELKKFNMEIIVPDEQLIKFKEALIMALLGVLRWREENTTLHSVTGATRSSIGGAVWIGQHA